MKKTEADNKRIVQSKQTRQRLLDAGLELFVYKGYGGTTVRDITTQAKVSPGLMFHYFDSKEAILKELLLFMNTGIEGIAALLSDDTRPPLEVATEVAEIILGSFGEEKSKQLFLLSNQLAISTYVPPDVRALLKTTTSVNATVPLIRRGQTDGSIRSGDPYMLALVFWGALQGIAELLVWQPDAELPGPDYVASFLQKM